MTSNLRPFRADALQKATGEAKYSADVYMPGMLRAKILWPQYPVAKIIKIDTSRAEALPGVEKVVTRRDITGPNLAAVFEPYDRPVLVGEGEEVRFWGDAVALVAARTEEIAAEALEKIQVEYQPLPGIFTLEEAREKLEPCFTFEIKRGNVAGAFSRADIIVESDYYFPYVEHAFLEPEGGYAFLDGTGVIQLSFPTQNPERHHRMICKSLGLPFQKVRILAPYLGGGFGGKHSFNVQVYLALLAHLLRKPVKLVWTREESFIAGKKRHQISARAKLGLDRNGKILALDAEVFAPAGPYMGYSVTTMRSVIRCVLGPYWVEYIQASGKVYHTNNNEIGIFRGFGSTEGTFIIETLIEKAAHKLNRSSAEIRRINWLREDQVANHFPEAPWELVSDKITLEETLAKALSAAGPRPKEKEGKKVGRGIAVAMPSFGFGEMAGGYRSSGADMTMLLDGSVNVRVGFPEAGQGVTGVITRITSEVLGLPEDKISIVYPDTHTTPKGGSLGFSQTTVVLGNALLIAAQKLKERLEEHARECLKTREINDEALLAQLEFKRGGFYMGDRVGLKLDEFMDYCYRMGKNMTVSGWFEGTSPVDKRGITFMSSVVDVAIDEETGEIQVLKIVTCHDIGKVIHEMSAKGQLTGGALMAMGVALQEEFITENGKPITTSFAEYLLHTAKDMPMENIPLFVEWPGKNCPLGAKGLGEHPLYSVVPAISNAIFDATSASITHLPITPERLLKALKKI